MKSYSFVRENAYKVLYPWKTIETEGPPKWYKGQIMPELGSFKQFLYYTFAPTLLYRDKYPRCLTTYVPMITWQTCDCHIIIAPDMWLSHHYCTRHVTVTSLLHQTCDCHVCMHARQVTVTSCLTTGMCLHFASYDRAACCHMYVRNLHLVWHDRYIRMYVTLCVPGYQRYVVIICTQVTKDPVEEGPVALDWVCHVRLSVHHDWKNFPASYVGTYPNWPSQVSKPCPTYMVTMGLVGL